VTDRELLFGYNTGWTSVALDKSSVASVEVLPHINGLREFGGWGLRKRLWTWETGYIPKDGPGLRVTVVKPDGGRSGGAAADKKNGVAYTFLCDDPETVAELLKKEGGKLK